MRASRARPPARSSLLVHRSYDDNTSGMLFNKHNYHNTLSLNLHIGFCCCHQRAVSGESGERAVSLSER